MKIKFCGGAREVTGSQILFEINGKKIMVECGMFQGAREECYEKNRNFLIEPSEIDALIITHAHIDHSGNIPNLVRQGFTGSIYATEATVDLCKIMLRDSAYLMEKDIEWVNRIRTKQKLPLFKVPYTMEDVEKTLHKFVSIEFNRPFTIAPGVTVRFRTAGHILGSASILLEIEENGKESWIGISGDVGREGMPVIRDPDRLRDLDALIIETTYGNRSHGAFDDVEEELAQTIREVTSHGGKVIVPAFAIGRTQTLVYLLHILFNQNRIPEIPIFVDSPLACKATEVFRAHEDSFDRQTQRIFLDDNEDPFGFRRLTYIEDTQASKNLNGLTYPHIIISASGMAEGGRILHHLRHNLGNHKNLVLFVGYAARNTLARKLMDGEKVVKIFGEEHQVRCKIKTMDSFSAHADRRELLEYVKMSTPERLKNIFLIHGEPEQAASFKNALRSMGYPRVHYPDRGEEYTI